MVLQPLRPPMTVRPLQLLKVQLSTTMSEAGTALEFGPTDSVKIVYDETNTVSVDLQVVCAWSKVRV